MSFRCHRRYSPVSDSTTASSRAGRPSCLAVAVIGSGLRATHEDFAGRVLNAVNFTSGKEDDVTDNFGVSTFEAGIIVGDGVNKGIAPNAHIAALKVLDRQSGSATWGSVTKALDWVLKHHSDDSDHRISVVALGVADRGNYQSLEQALREDQQFSAVAELISALTQKRIAVVAPAGNGYGGDSNKVGMPFPSIHPDTISVGGSQVVNCLIRKETQLAQQLPTVKCSVRIATYSQRLPHEGEVYHGTDVFAPVGPLISTSTKGDKASGSLQGTSISMAITAGGLLLIQEYFREVKKELPSPAKLETWLRSGARLNDYEHDAEFVHLDLYAAMRHCRDVLIQESIKRKKN